MGNWIFDLLFVLIAAVLIFACAKRGFIKSIIHFFKTLLAFVAAYLFGGQLAAFLCDHWIGGAVRGFVYGKIDAIYQGAAGSLDADAVIESMPSFLITEEVQAQLHAAQGSGEMLVNSMTDSISAPIASLFSNVLGYLLTFVIALIVLWIAAALLTKLVEHISLLHTLNVVLGCVLGLLIAVTVLLVLSSIIKFFFADSALYTESVVVKFFGESFLLKTLRFLDVGSTWFAELLH